MDERLRLKCQESTREIIINDCPSFDFSEIKISTSQWDNIYVNLDINQMDLLSRKLRRIVHEKMYLRTEKNNSN